MERRIEVPPGSLADKMLDFLSTTDVPIRRIHLRFDLWRQLCDEICADDEWIGSFNGVPIMAGKPVRTDADLSA